MIGGLVVATRRTNAPLAGVAAGDHRGRADRRARIEVGDLCFAVPAAWSVPARLCGDLRLVGVVLPVGAAKTPARALHPGVVTLPDARLVIEPSTGPASEGESATIGTLAAHRVDAGCTGCPAAYRLDHGVQVTAVGADAAAVLATFTDSSARRALQRGPLADTTGWQTVHAAGLAIDVPAAWASINLPASNTGTNEAVNLYTTRGSIPESAAAPCSRPPSRPPPHPRCTSARRRSNQIAWSASASRVPAATAYGCARALVTASSTRRRSRSYPFSADRGAERRAAGRIRDLRCPAASRGLGGKQADRNGETRFWDCSTFASGGRLWDSCWFG